MNNPLVQPDPGLFIWTILTFLVLLFMLRKFAWKPLLSMLEKREEMIRKSLDDAEQAKLELEQLSQESQEIVDKARTEAQNIVSDGKSTAEKVKEDILRTARDKADMIVEDAKKQIKSEKDKAIGEIKSEVVDLSLQIANKLIGKNITKSDNQTLIEKSMKEINLKHEA
ncbi:MAG: F0F1 ATP synthase subunit B [Candidatus Marinimicrobia bacterium]|nr:F0F1 ATP synthase subunit B [Candidatus Neomarinimicrobiota bacterium]MBL7059478.1 F0F1 ATP synthase subunit B [Candidatus Neomarinimicrobiota bacterium]